MNLLAELRRRSIFRVAAAYLISGWVVMQVVALIATSTGMPEWTTSFVLMLMIAGLPIALIIAWAFELSPDGPKRTEAAGDGTVKPFSATDGVLIAALVVVVGVVAWQQLAPSATVVVETPIATDEANGPDPASIAVLAFDDLSPDGDQEYFSDGISEELLNVLVRVEGLQVASRTSAFRFKGSDADIPEIAAQLNVRHVVEGSVRRSGETIRVTAQLIDSSTDRHLWSDTYDRDLNAQSIFEIQDEIASAIVAALSEELGTFLPQVEVEAATENLTALDLYLQARPIYIERGDLELADSYLAQAVELDPEYAEAWELRAAIYLLYSLDYGPSGTNHEASAVLAVQYANRALALDPQSSLAITVQTFALHPVFAPGQEVAIDADNIPRSIEGYTRALEIDPHNTTANNWRGIVYLYTGFLELARADFVRCIELEPLYTPCYNNLVQSHGDMGSDELAFEASRAAWKEGVTPFVTLGMFARLGKRDLFLTEAASLYGTNVPWGTNDVLYEMYQNPEGDFDHLIPAIATWVEEDETGRWFVSAAPDLIIGNYGHYRPGMIYFWDPELAGFRASDEFQEFLAQTPLPEYWRAHGFPPQCRERNDGWIECD